MTDHSEPVAEDTPGRGARTERSTILHIGTMKSGTTFVQQVLWHHRDRLTGSGVCFPGRPGYAQQIAAVRDVLDLRGPLGPAEVDGAWRACWTRSGGGRAAPLSCRSNS